MKKPGILIKICFVFMLILLSSSNAFAVPSESSSSASEQIQLIPYPPGYDTSKEGASAYKGIGNVKSSPYYPELDFYNMKSTESLTFLSHFKTYQQTTEVTCGPAVALMVLNYYGHTNADELYLAKAMNTHHKTGTSTSSMVHYFKQSGWAVTSSLDVKHNNGNSFVSVKEFQDFVIDNLRKGTPIMVENVDWAGHWRVIIGYDTLGTPSTADDALILADPYDTADHWQDGYVINPAEKFFYMWFDSNLLPKGQKKQQWLITEPPKN